MKKILVSLSFLFMLATLLSGCGGGGNASTVRYTIGGQIQGLATGQQVSLRMATGESLIMKADGRFTFKNSVEKNGSYAVSIGAQPNGAICTVSNGTGAGVVANVENVHVTCSAVTYTISGMLAGLPPGQHVTLLNNGANPLIVKANGKFVFDTPVAANSGYQVTVAPNSTTPGTTCAIADNTGTGAGVVANVESVRVVCSAVTYAIGGTVTGLSDTQQVTLENGGDPVTVRGNSDGKFTFANRIPHNGSYAVTVAPNSTTPGTTCAIADNTGTGAGVVADVESVRVVCSALAYTLSGTVTGLIGEQQVTLENGGDPVTVRGNSDGKFTFANRIPHNGSYAVTVAPNSTTAGTTCAIADNTGTGAGVVANVESVRVVCSALTYGLSGTVTGLTGDQQVTLENGSDPVTVRGNSDGKFTFANRIPHNGSYAVTVAPNSTTAGATCAIANNSGTGAGVVADVQSVRVVCSALTYTLSGTVMGLTGDQQVTLVNNQSNAKTVSTNGEFLFTDPIPHNGSYEVTVSTHPTGATCTVSNGSGRSVTANVSTVEVKCSATAFKIGGTVVGLKAGQGVNLKNNGYILGINSTGSANIPFNFTQNIAYGSSYNVTVDTQPTAQSCTVSNGSGSNITVNMSNINVTCGDQVNTFARGFNNPTALAFDKAGNLYVANKGNHTISKVAPNGEIRTFTGFSSPNGLAFDASGNLYVANGTRSNINIIAPNGDISTFVNGFNSSGGLAFDTAGNLYVGVGAVIKKVTPDKFISDFAKGFTQANSFAFDTAGNLFLVTNINGYTISKVSPDGKKIEEYARGSGGINGLAFDAAGNLYMSNMLINRIDKISPTHQSSWISGTPNTAGANDGTRANATFNGPNFLTFDTAGNLYVSDSNNNAVRRIGP